METGTAKSSAVAWGPAARGATFLPRSARGTTGGRPGRGASEPPAGCAYRRSWTDTGPRPPALIPGRFACLQGGSDQRERSTVLLWNKEVEQ